MIETNDYLIYGYGFRVVGRRLITSTSIHTRDIAKDSCATMPPPVYLGN